MLDDLLVALRSVERPGGLGCSIDPKPDNLARLNEQVQRNNYAMPVERARALYPQYAKTLGMQDVRIWGVPAESHYAKVLVEADYRMKLITMGLEVTPVKTLKSYLSTIAPGKNAIHRWWFAPKYDTFVKSEDGLAYQFEGQRAQLFSQDELTNQAGQRMDAPTTRASVQKYAQHFTEKFPELAKVSPVFAELQNIIDLAVMAALLKKEQLPQKVGWKPSLFLDEERATLAKVRMFHSQVAM